MARFVRPLTGCNFAAGVTYYKDHYPNDEEPSPRMVLELFVVNRTAPFIVDTGAPWCVLDPAIAKSLIDSGYADHMFDARYYVRGYWYAGKIFRINMHLVDYHNPEKHTSIEATVFVPMLDADEEWLHPNFIGLDGFLNRMRFAVDPEENAFYFGAD